MASELKERAVLAALVAALASGRIEVVDLTQVLAPDFPTIVLPPELGQCQPVRIEEVSRYDPRGPSWYWNTITVGEHAGTHFDAPIHWITGRHLRDNSVDTLPPQGFVAPAVVINCVAAANADEDYLLDCRAIEAFEAKHDVIPQGAWVLMRTDWSKRNGAAYANIRQDGAHSPGVTADAISFLVHMRGILGFGTETIGTDSGQAQYLSPPYPAHTILHGAGRVGLQCLTNLDRLPATGAVLFAAPLKIRNGSGSPLRVIALLEKRAQMPPLPEG
jgi:kynurenine formamidase